MSAIIPTTLSELPRLASYAPPGTEFYVKEISTLDRWQQGVPHLPHNRVWCGFNSFNIPDPDADHALLSLQGAGDLLFLSQFVHDIGDLSHVTSYTNYASILGKGITALPVMRNGPTDMRLCRIRHKYSYVSNHPMALQFLRTDAIAIGWDLYDWFGLMLGIKPQEKWVHIDWRDDPYPPLVEGSRPIVALHLVASAHSKRDVLWLLPRLYRRFGSEVRFLLLGGSESAQLPAAPYNFAGQTSYHGTYRLLQNPLVSAVIAADSVVLHLASVARDDLPVLGVYTATPTTWSGPRRSGVDVIRIDKSDMKGVELWLRKKMLEVTR